MKQKYTTKYLYLPFSNLEQQKAHKYLISWFNLLTPESLPTRK